MGRGALRAWYLNEAGADLAESIPYRAEDRCKLLDPRQASGPLQAHTLAVNELGLCFLRAARERGDEFSPRSWRHEVAHGPAPGMRRGELLIADAVFAYMVVSEQDLALEYRFCELDRGTLPSERLARKLARYARLYRFRPRPERRGGQAREADLEGSLPGVPDRPRLLRRPARGRASTPPAPGRGALPHRAGAPGGDEARCDLPAGLDHRQGEAKPRARGLLNPSPARGSPIPICPGSSPARLRTKPPPPLAAVQMRP